jgi:hypothetical protein
MYIKRLERQATSPDLAIRHRARAEIYDLKYGPWNGPRR